MGGMNGAGEKGDDREAGLRPLVACAAASGVMTLGVLQFLGEVWADLTLAARLAMLEAARTAFFAFLFALAALVLGWFAGRGTGPLWRGAVTLFGLLAFVGSALIVTNRISRALAALLPPGTGNEPSGEIGGYIGVGVLALALLASSLVVTAVISLARRENDV